MKYCSLEIQRFTINTKYLTQIFSEYSELFNKILYYTLYTIMILYKNQFKITC